jgi:hypothetical protein
MVEVGGCRDTKAYRAENERTSQRRRGRGHGLQEDPRWRTPRDRGEAYGRVDDGLVAARR